MKKQTVFLEQIHIKNFMSLRDVVLPLKRLTVLVGPNASGKSNILRSLELLKRMMYAENPPPADFIRNVLWTGSANNISFQFQMKKHEIPINYRLELKTISEDENQIALEELIVDKVNVISVKNGRGKVRDEDDKNPTLYRPSKPKLALKTASDYGNKPVTNALTEFIRGWEFYDFEPDIMRGGDIFHRKINREINRNSKRSDRLPGFNDDGSALRDILSYLSENDKKCFDSVNEAFESCTKLKIEYRNSDGDDDDDLYVWEGCEHPVSLRKASDGTMRLLAYHVLANLPELPSLIAIEEPERNLHSAALKEIASILERLSERTQVIITTHSSQLLDAFNPENLSDQLGVLLLQNIPGKGTKVINLEEKRKDREALNGWMTDFGIGSAVFDSELLQDFAENRL
jgi:predicted ATPase